MSKYAGMTDRQIIAAVEQELRDELTPRTDLEVVVEVHERADEKGRSFCTAYWRQGDRPRAQCFTTKLGEMSKRFEEQGRTVRIVNRFDPQGRK